MTTYEQYVAVATYIKNNWTQTKFFTLGEVIENEKEFIVLNAFGVGVGSCLSGKHLENHTAYSIMCYGANRPKSLKIASEVQVQFTNKKVSHLLLESGEIKSTLKLDDNLFETEVIFKTSSDIQLQI